MKKKGNNDGGAKKRIALAAAVVGVFLLAMTSLFARDVKEQLWEQSVGNLMEATQQGCKTLKVQLQHDFETMATVAEQLQTVSSADSEYLNVMAGYFRQLEGSGGLYLEGGSIFPNGIHADEEAVAVLRDNAGDRGIIDPHISSVTGVNVFQLYTEVTLQDGVSGYLVKEYEVSGIVDTFSLSFYNDAGFSYVVNTRGDVLIRPPHPGSNKTVKNLFDMFPEPENDKGSLDQFAQALEEQRTGRAVFSYQGERTVFCYTPLGLGADWYLISIIPEKVVNAQTTNILMRSFALIGGIILGIVLLVVYYIIYVNRTNKKLRSQADYIGHLYNAVPEGIALLTVEEPCTLLQLNEEGLRLLGYPEGTPNDALKGRPLRMALLPEDYPSIGQLLREMADKGGKNVFEYRTVKADGSCFWSAGIVEKTLDENGIPVLIAAFHDITDEKLAEEEAEREKRQERLTLVGAISNAYPVIISMNLTKDTLNFVYVQPGLMTPLGTQTSYSQLFEDMLSTVHPEDQARFRRRFSPESLHSVLGREKKEVFLEVRQMMNDGNYHWTSTQIIDVDNPYSQERLAVIISRRVDEQRYEQEQRRQALQSALDNARAASDAKSRFLSNMSHDIRTPMNAIIGMTAIASAHLDEKEKLRDYLDKISLSSSHLLSLINDILDMSRIENGKITLREEAFNLRELVSDTADLVSPQARAKHLKLEVSAETLQNENVVGDSLRIRQIFLNILSNAVKYTPEGGSVSVEIGEGQIWRKGVQSFLFKCTDSGIGMDSDFLERLFLPFERARNSTASRIAGTGLGMAITKNLVDLMNGDIAVESCEGRGSVFTVTLPLQLQDEGSGGCGEEQTVSDSREPEHDFTGRRILLVEDNELNREIAREMVSETGAEIEEACDGEQAVSRMASSEEGYFDLILMDIQMPKMDGYEATKAIRNLNRKDAAKIPIIAMTANAFDEDVRTALRAGMNAHFAKPIGMEDFRRILGRFLAAGKEGQDG